MRCSSTNEHSIDNGGNDVMERACVIHFHCDKISVIDIKPALLYICIVGFIPL